MQATPFTFHAIAEAAPGHRWQTLFRASWPSYRRWFLQEGDHARPSYVTSRRMLREHLPELAGTYDRLCDLAGGGDQAARMLALWRPTPYLAGCSQAALRGPAPALVRNYDYAPDRFEGVIVSTRWNERRVIGMSDCLWGLLDGINDDGLAVSLTFGGRQVVGDGFGIPIVVRYLLETCSTVAEACATLARIPVSLAHNLTLADAGGDAATVEVAPDRSPQRRDEPVATNHQGAIEWPEHARFTRTLEREAALRDLVADPAMTATALAEAFLAAPVRSTAYSRGFGTLYTACYEPLAGRATFSWPGASWSHSFASFGEGVHTTDLVEQAA
jgi:predicted choloylglycine hydrolase